jgi:hypothetical protein
LRESGFKRGGVKRTTIDEMEETGGFNSSSCHTRSRVADGIDVKHRKHDRSMN